MPITVRLELLERYPIYRNFHKIGKIPTEYIDRHLLDLYVALPRIGPPNLGPWEDDRYLMHGN